MFGGAWGEEIEVSTHLSMPLRMVSRRSRLFPVMRRQTGLFCKYHYFCETNGFGNENETSAADHHGNYDSFLQWCVEERDLQAAVGKKISWYFELGICHAFMGCMTGLSWRL